MSGAIIPMQQFSEKKICKLLRLAIFLVIGGMVKFMPLAPLKREMYET